MIARLLRFALYALLLVAVVIALLLILLVAAPQQALRAASLASGLQIQAEAFTVSPWPVELNADKLTVSQKDDTPLLRANDLKLSVDLPGLIAPEKAFWSLRSNQLDVYTRGDEGATEGPQQASAALDFARLLGFESIQLGQVGVHSEASSTVYRINAERQSPEQFKLRISSDANLDLAATVTHRNQTGQHLLQVRLQPLDLRPLLGSQQADSQPVSGAEEAEINWAWLGLLRNLRLTLDTERLDLPGLSLEQLSTQILFAVRQLTVEEFSTDLMLESNDQPTAFRGLTLKGTFTTVGTQTTGLDGRGEVKLSAPGLSASVDGELNLNGIDGQQALLSIMLSDQSVLTSVLPPIASTYLPIDLTASINGRGETLELADLKLTAGKSDLAGHLSLHLEAQQIIQAKLHSNNLQLGQSKPTELTPAQAAESVQTREAAAPDQQNRLFSETPLDWQWIENNNWDITFTADRLGILAAPFTELSTRLQLEEGRLLLEPFQAALGGGGFSGTGSVQLDSNTPQLSTVFQLDGVDLEAFGVVPQEQLAGGKTAVDIQLNSHGYSVAELAANSQGTLHVLVHDAVIQNDSIELLGSDLLLETLNKLNPFAKSDPTTQLQCALLHFDIKDGVATSDKALVMETEKMEIIGDGDINLHNEQLNILITPAAKQGVGLDVGSVVKFMKLGGSLAQPKPTVDAAGLLKSTASIGAAMSTGGLSMLAEKVVKTVSGENACRSALTTLRKADTVNDSQAQRTDTTTKVSDEQ